MILPPPRRQVEAAHERRERPPDLHAVGVEDVPPQGARAAGESRHVAKAGAGASQVPPGHGVAPGRLEKRPSDDLRGVAEEGHRAVVRGRGTESLHFETVNGGIDLTLPADLGADLEARTVNGSITSDFPVSVTGRINPRRLTGRIGSGGRRLDLETVNGSIRVHSLR